MKLLRLSLPLLLCLACASRLAAADPFNFDKKKETNSSASSDHDKKKPHGPGLLNRLFPSLGGKKTSTTGKTAEAERWVGKQRVHLDLTVDPQPLKLSDARQLKVTLHVSNPGKKMVQLEFPTTQRIEVLVRDKVGKLVEQWSEDRTFANDPGMVSINPGERLEYAATISTRDLAAGQTYSIEALFPNYEPLRLQKDVTPEK